MSGDAELDAFTVERKSGQEAFTIDGAPTGSRLAGFWSWAYSDLTGNAMRGVLAEYIVGTALECLDGRTRQEWDDYDLCTAEDVRVEVKSASPMQTWRQEQPSRVAFSIAPTQGWDARTNVYTEVLARRAHVYVFCVFRPQHKATMDPLDLDAWEFYVLATPRLDGLVGAQKRIGLAGLLRLEPRIATFRTLPECVRAAADHG